MAAITSANNLFADAGAQRGVLMRLFGVNSGDSVDVSVVGPFAFRKVQAAFFCGHDQRLAVGAVINGTVLTLTSPGLALDAVDLYVLGE